MRNSFYVTVTLEDDIDLTEYLDDIPTADILKYLNKREEETKFPDNERSYKDIVIEHFRGEFDTKLFFNLLGKDEVQKITQKTFGE